MAQSFPAELLKKYAEEAQVMAWVCYRVSEKERMRARIASFLAIGLTLATILTTGLDFFEQFFFFFRLIAGAVSALLIMSQDFFGWKETAANMRTDAQKFSHLATRLQIMLVGNEEGVEPKTLLVELQELENHVSAIPESVQSAVRERFKTKSIPTVAGGIPTIRMGEPTPRPRAEFQSGGEGPAPTVVDIATNDFSTRVTPPSSD